MNLHAFLLGQTMAPTIDARDVYRSLLDDGGILEQLGFHGVWLAEHHFSNYVLVPNPLTLLAAMARTTRSIRLGTSVIVLPLRNPVLVAEEAAMVDQLSEGRLELGFGRGYQPYEFKCLNIPYDEATSRMRESLDLLTHLWTRPDEAFHGKHFQAPGFSVTPAPRQLPHPPLWMAAGSPASVGEALDRGMSIVMNVGNNGPAKAEQMAEMFRAECARRGIAPGSVRFALQTHGYLVESRDDEAKVVRSGGFLHRVQVRLREQRQSIVRGLNDASGSEAGEPTYEGWSSASLIGSRDHIERQLTRFAGLGLTDLFVTMRFGEFETPGIRRSMQAIAEAARRMDLLSAVPHAQAA